MAFEILGVDIMVNHKLKPYLIEINHAPSFKTDSPIDELIKENVIFDTFGILYNVGTNARMYNKLRRRSIFTINNNNENMDKNLITKDINILLKYKDDYQ